MKLFANILTFNKLEYIQNLIPQALEFCDELVVVDSFSTDGSFEWLEEVSETLPIRLYQNKWKNFGEQRQFALDHTPKESWFIRIDTDEVPSIGLKKRIRDILSQQEIEKGRSIGYAVPIYSLEGDMEHYNPTAWMAEMRIFYNRGKLKWRPGMHEALIGDIPQLIFTKEIAFLHFDRIDKEMLAEKINRYKTMGIKESRDYSKASSLKKLPKDVTYEISNTLQEKLAKQKR